MKEEVKKAIEAILIHYYEDEKTHFETCSEAEKQNHIYNSLELLKKQIGLK